MLRIPDRPLYLASRSPRRRELLTHAGVRFYLLPLRSGPRADAEPSEEALPGEAPRDYVERIARAKADAGWTRLLQRNLPRAPVLAADTTVALDGRVYGKPVSREEAANILAALSGHRHEVLTSVALKFDERLETAFSLTEVQFAELSEQDIRAYLASGEADDKAGAYGVQGRAAQFVIEIRGSYTGVVGLPLYETLRLIEKFNAFRERRNPR